MSERNVESVVGLLRPLLKDLQVQQLGNDPVVLKASSYRELVVAGLSNCIVMARQTGFSDDTKGCFSFSYDTKHDIFLFVISVNKNLFFNDFLDLRVARKAVAVHEFIHCVSALLLLSRLRKEAFIERTQSIIQKKVRLTTSHEFNNLLSALRELGKNDKYAQPELLADEHFRISDEDDFNGNYGDLYLNFLLSYQLLRETIEAIKYNIPGILFTKLLIAVHQELVEKKALQRDFVLGRIKMFLPKIISDLAY
jgi:hypothetical protein